MSPLPLLFFFSFLLLIPLVSGHADGAGACFGTGYTKDLSDFIYYHGGKESSDTGKFRIIYHTNNAHPTTQFIPGCSYTMTICRSPYSHPVVNQTNSGYNDAQKKLMIDAAAQGTFGGLLLLSKGLSDTSSYAGSFSIPKVSASVLKTKSCPNDIDYGATNGGKSAVITHSSAIPKSSPLHIVWNAPEDANDINIHLFAVASIQSDWYHIKQSMTANHALHGTTCPALVNPSADVCGSTNNNNNNNNTPNINDGLDTNSGHDGHSMGHVMSGAMFSYFTTNAYKQQYIIFPSWYLGTGSHYAGTVICFLLLAILTEFLSSIQMRTERYWNQQKKISSYTVKTTTSTYTVTGNNNNNPYNNNNNNNNTDDEYTLTQQSIRSAFYFIRTFLSMILMIAFMSMDVGFFFAVLIGYTVGFFLFARGKKNNNNKDGGMTDIEQGGKTAACH